MAVTVSNIIVGQATVSLGDTVAAVEDIGATQDGVELSWEPDMVDIEVDQFGDAAKVIQSMVKVMLKTTLAEGTLRNLARAWGYDDTLTGDDIKLNQDGSDTRTFMFGIENVYPHEKAIVTVGNAPGTSAAATKTRTFTAKRAISYAASSHSMKRAEATVFPVEFRILPTVADTNYEYGKIIDSTA
tara:strand:- start:1849 stop:2406 length:558 start_codon:yes stop_codon:yes gene_type:complete